MRHFELVVPAYNEAKNLEKLVNRAVEAAQISGYTSEQFQLVLVNNGSADNSAQVMEQLQKTSVGPWFRVVTVTHNQGYGYGVHKGLKSTDAKYVAWSHADLQCDPNDAFKALKILEASTEKTLVKGVRSGRDWKDKMVSRVFELFARVLLGLKVYEMNAQPKVFSKDLLGYVTNPPKTFAFDLYVLYQAQKAGYEFKTVDVLFPPRIHGVSNWASNFMSRYKTILGMINYMRQLGREEGRI